MYPVSLCNQLPLSLTVAEGPSINGRAMSHDFIGASPKPAKYLSLKIYKYKNKLEKPKKNTTIMIIFFSLGSYKSLNFLDIKILLPKILS